MKKCMKNTAFEELSGAVQADEFEPQPTLPAECCALSPVAFFLNEREQICILLLSCRCRASLPARKITVLSDYGFVVARDGDAHHVRSKKRPILRPKAHWPGSFAGSLCGTSYRRGRETEAHRSKPNREPRWAARPSLKTAKRTAEGPPIFRSRARLQPSPKSYDS